MMGKQTKKQAILLPEALSVSTSTYTYICILLVTQAPAYMFRINTEVFMSFSFCYHNTLTEKV